MTFRCQHGLTFKVFSPSLYELHAHDDGGAIALVTVAYNGTGWFIHVLMKHNAPTVVRGPFVSFAHACEVIAFGQARAS